MVVIAPRRPNSLYILDQVERKKIEAKKNSRKDDNEGNIKKKEVMLSVICSGGAAPNT